MRLSQFSTPETDGPWCGAFTEAGDVVDLPTAGVKAGIEIPGRLSALLGEWNWRTKAELAVEYAEDNDVARYDAASLDRHEPITSPEKVVCVGLNYREHAAEGDNPLPEEPVLFSKFPTTIIGPGDDVVWDPDYTSQVDYEAELVVVIGREAKDVAADDAEEYVAGITAGNDVSARDLQHGDEQWVRGKSLDTFGPTGPDLVTLDEVGDPHDLDIWTEVNGERLQDSATSDLIFGIDELVAFCSRTFTLRPGDLIFTGTPPGVGVYREPQTLLEDGDTVTVGLGGVGELTNVCRTQSD